MSGPEILPTPESGYLSTTSPTPNPKEQISEEVCSDMIEKEEEAGTGVSIEQSISDSDRGPLAS